VPSVYFIQTAVLEKLRGLNLNKCYPEQEKLFILKLESTYAIGEAPELTVIDLIILSKF
jgi:hypothetical protein